MGISVHVLVSSKRAKSQNSNSATIWLDIANDYGSIHYNQMPQIYKDTTKGFSVNYFLKQQLVLDIDINAEF